MIKMDVPEKLLLVEKHLCIGLKAFLVLYIGLAKFY